MKLQIVSDGTPRGTKVTDEEGRFLERVQSIHWEIRQGSFSHVTIELLDVPLKATMLDIPDPGVIRPAEDPPRRVIR